MSRDYGGAITVATPPAPAFGGRWQPTCVHRPGWKCGGQSVGVCLRSAFVIYQDPLAYLLGLEGIALLDAWAGDHDRAFTDTRLAEIRRLLDDQTLRGRGVLAEWASTVTAYEQHSASYDAHAG